MKSRVAVFAVLACALLSFAPTASSSDSLSDAGVRRTVFKRGSNVQRASTAAAPAGGPVLLYHGGRILPQSTTHALFWAPSGYSFPTDYENVINQYFTDVAADRFGDQNVHSVGTQYFDRNRAGQIAHKARYNVIDGGPTTITTAYPLSGCTVTSGYTDCLTDSQIRTEIKNHVTGTGLNDIYFMFLPEGVDTCAGPGDCARSTFCAYHWAFNSPSGTVLYANQPFASVDGCRIPAAPNGNEADDTLNVVSHEHNETVTDPLGSAWFTSRGAENGDLCSFNFGSFLGADYNQIINGDHYLLQMEWSNASRRCRQRGH